MTNPTPDSGLRRTGLLGWSIYTAIAALLALDYHVLGNTVMTEVYSASALRWMRNFWDYAQAYGGAPYVQGWLFPPLALWLIWRQRDALRAEPRQVNFAGLALLVLALFAHWAGAKSQQTRLSLISLVVVLWAIPLYLGGGRMAWRLLFPCAMLLFCVPLNFFDSALFPLRIAATRTADVVLNGLGVDVRSSGSTISMANGFVFDAVDAAGSLRNLLALLAFAAVLGHLRQTTAWKQWAVFALGLPLALLANTLRMVVSGLFAEAVGPATGATFQQHVAGPLVLGLGAGLIACFSAALKSNIGQRFRACKSPITDITSSSSGF